MSQTFHSALLILGRPTQGGRRGRANAKTRPSTAVYTRLTGDTGAYALARDIARYLLAVTPERVERGDLVQGVAAFRVASDRDQGKALRLLEDLGWLRSDSGGYRKGAPTRLTVNPTLPVTMAEQVERERALR